MSAAPGPFELNSTRDICVRKDDHRRWSVSCSDCWAFGFTRTWREAMTMANYHAADLHQVHQ